MMNQDDYYSSEEIGERLSSLSDEEYTLLIQIATNRWGAAKLRGNRDGSPDDLLGEAIYRTLKRRAKWRRSVKFRTHFWQLLRHIACEWAGNGQKAADGDLVLRNEQEYKVKRAEEASPVTDEIFECEVFERAEKIIFKNDEIAWQVLESRIGGSCKKDIMDCFGMDETEYETISRRIRRKLEKYKNGEGNEIK